MLDVKFFICTPNTFLRVADIYAIGERYESLFYKWLKERPHIQSRAINAFEAAEFLMKHEESMGIGCYVPVSPLNPDHVLANKYRFGISQIRAESFLTRHLKGRRGLMIPTVRLPSVPLRPKPAPREVLRLRMALTT